MGDHEDTVLDITDLVGRECCPGRPVTVVTEACWERECYPTGKCLLHWVLRPEWDHGGPVLAVRTEDGWVGSPQVELRDTATSFRVVDDPALGELPHGLAGELLRGLAVDLLVDHLRELGATPPASSRSDDGDDAWSAVVADLRRGRLSLREVAAAGLPPEEGAAVAAEARADRERSYRSRAEGLERRIALQQWVASGMPGTTPPGRDGPRELLGATWPAPPAPAEAVSGGRLRRCWRGGGRRRAR